MSGFADILKDDKKFSAEDALQVERDGAVDLDDFKRSGSSKMLLQGARAEEKGASSLLHDDKSHKNTLRGVRKSQKRKIERAFSELDDDEEFIDDEGLLDKERAQRALRAVGSLAAVSSASESDDDIADDLGKKTNEAANSAFARARKLRANSAEPIGAEPLSANAKKAQAKKRAGQKKARKRIVSKAKQTKKIAVTQAVKSSQEAAKARVAQEALRNVPKIGAAAAGSGVAAVIVCLVSVLMIIGILVGVITGAKWEEDHRYNFGDMTETEQIVAQYLLSHGLDELHTAAIMGNISQECSFDPSLIENGSALGIGIFQWPTTGDYWNGMSHGNRFKAYAASTNRDWTDIYAQLDYAWYEIAHEEVSGYPSHYSDNQWCWNRESGCIGFKNANNIHDRASYENFLAIDDISVATEYFCWGFLRPASSAAHVDTRINGDGNGHKGALYYYAILSGAGAAEGGTAVERAYAQLGKPYVWGAAGPNSFDCSGLVSYCITGKYEHTWSTADMQHWQRVAVPLPGDFCLNSHHTGVYIGNGQMIHAPRTGDVVKISKVHSDMYYVRYTG